MPWKQKTKVSIMKRIKDNIICRAIPNSETIQKVLDTFGRFFATKTETKYFLTVIGDNMLKKRMDLVHLIPQKTKSFLAELVRYVQLYTGANPIATFRYKYHDHEYSLCRLLHTNDYIRNEYHWSQFMGEYALDIICVCYHYSARYGDAELY
jgi:hypothetical protein